MAEPTEQHHSSPYSFREYLITDRKQRTYVIHAFDFSTDLANTKHDPRVQQAIESLRPLTDQVFPKTRRGEQLEEALMDSLNETSILLTCTTPGQERMVGFLALTRQHFGDLSVLHIGLAGIDPAHRGGHLSYQMREEILRRENADIIWGNTINPGIYRTYEEVATTLGYEFYPTSKHAPKNVIRFTKDLLQAVSGDKAVKQLDNHMVRRKYLPTSPQGENVSRGFQLFDQMNVTEQDGVVLLLVKPGIIPNSDKDLRRILSLFSR